MVVREPYCEGRNQMAQSDRSRQGVVVQIYGEEYQIAAQGDPREVQRIAEYVDAKMRELAGQHANRVPRATLAVLAAMEITSELLGTVREQDQLTETARENLERLSRLVDERADLFSSLVESTSQAFSRRLQDRPLRQPAAVAAE
jgi:cell division protein ZapA (FtsZ GTPase activity inhibitor)